MQPSSRPRRNPKLENRQRGRIVGLCSIGGSLLHLMAEVELREGVRLEKERLITDFLQREDTLIVIPTPSETDVREALFSSALAWKGESILDSPVSTSSECAEVPQGRYVIGIDLASNAPDADFASTVVCRTDSSQALVLWPSDEIEMRKMQNALSALHKFPTVPTSNRAQRRRQAREQAAVLRHERKLQRRNNNNTP